MLPKKKKKKKKRLDSALCFKIFENNEGNLAMLVHHARMGSL